ncbi:hypothetical protein BLS_002098 [Venturia inaequalis]|uniref:Uncharacterized protein n=1 Tax=Venturia inaequalis TaxID=5025 RepID=A0A8H3UW04_VENIN|nr:hypothetical protein BLS_002098 [Venturia inaequalis]
MAPIRSKSTLSKTADNNGSPKKPSEDPARKKASKNYRNSAWRKKAKNNKKENPKEDAKKPQVDVAAQRAWPGLNQFAIGSPLAHGFAASGPSALGVSSLTLMSFRPTAHTVPTASTTPAAGRERGVSEVQAQIDFGTMTAEALIYTVQRAADEMYRRLMIASLEFEPRGERKHRSEKGEDEDGNDSKLGNRK